jgi:hypothetical protein
MKRSVLRASLLVLLVVVAFVAGQLSASQPAMQAALRNLRAARADLNRAAADKGGHRERALELVNQAIDQVERGIAYDRRN